jgi:pyruvate dehydrogenase E2 component (dihydrolipoamide acetyltransferase)
LEKVIAPKLDLQTTEVEIVKWLKQDGDRVTQGEVILEIATEKATVAIEAPVTGVLRGISYGEGQRAKVGETLAFVTGENERIEMEEASRPSGIPETPPASQAALTGAPGQAPSQESGKATSVRSTPAARQLCKQHSTTIEEVFRALAREPVTEKEVREYLRSRTRSRSEATAGDSS